MKKQKHISMRIDEDILRKFHCVAKHESRSANGHIMYLITRSVREFEEEHGPIALDTEKAAVEAAFEGSRSLLSTAPPPP